MVSRPDPALASFDAKAPASNLEELSRLVRYYVLLSTTEAGSGHPSSGLSAADLMTALLFGGTFHYDVENPSAANNDRLIFSKGHASPLLYALWLAADRLSHAELMSYRKFGSTLEGHPTPLLDVVEAATGSLGQGLSIGLGMALNAKYLDRLPYRTFVLLGDSELTEGSQWEAIELAAHYQLGNLIGILDVNRLGQRGPTVHGHDCEAYQRRLAAFGWHVLIVDGHDLDAITAAYRAATQIDDTPTMVIAKTIKGKGVAKLEDKEDWHGKTLDAEQLAEALSELGAVDKWVRGRIPVPEVLLPESRAALSAAPAHYEVGSEVATRTAYGSALCRIASRYPKLVVLDGEVNNSTKTEDFAREHPHRFFEMYIAEQNMVSAALGLARRDKLPFVSTFAAFFTRAFDQIRMAAYSESNIKFVGSHAGVAIGADGPSQMGLEDIAMFRALLNSVVLHPCDAVSTEALTEVAAEHEGIVYLRTLRQKTPVIYADEDAFFVGGCQVLRRTPEDVVTIVACGATVHEALKAHAALKNTGVHVRVVDAYSIKPLAAATLAECARETGCVICVEDHYAEGGLGEAVCSALSEIPVCVYTLAVRWRPKSGSSEELLSFEGIDAEAICKKVRHILAASN